MWWARILLQHTTQKWLHTVSGVVLGQYPDKRLSWQLMADLSVSFGRRVRDLVDSPDYRDFPSVKLN